VPRFLIRILLSSERAIFINQTDRVPNSYWENEGGDECMNEISSSNEKKLNETIITLRLLEKNITRVLYLDMTRLMSMLAI
jgi:hypothetical protein